MQNYKESNSLSRYFISWRMTQISSNLRMKPECLSVFQKPDRSEAGQKIVQPQSDLECVLLQGVSGFVPSVHCTHTDHSKDCC